MQEEVKVDPVVKLMWLVDAYASALTGWSRHKALEARDAVLKHAQEMRTAAEALTWPPIQDPGNSTTAAERVRTRACLPPDAPHHGSAPAVRNKPLPPERPCFCDSEISLQSVAGGAHPTGLHGTVWLRIGDQTVEYVRKSSSPAVRNERYGGVL